jgi:hypothetical protein
MPFVQLPVEARVLFLIFSLSAIGYRRFQFADKTEIRVLLEQIWNYHKLSPADLRDGHRMSNLVKTYLEMSDRGESKRPQARQPSSRTKSK